MDFTRLPDESEIELLFRVVAQKKEKSMTWDDVARVMNELTGQNKCESAWRKQLKRQSQNNDYSPIPIDAYIENQASEDDDEMRSLQRERIRYRDERNAWNKQNYIDARAEQKLDYLTEQLTALGRVNFPPVNVRHIDGNDEMIILLSDWHIGQCFHGVFGNYDSDIAKERIAQFLENVKEYASLYKTRKAHVILCGDMVSGSIHRTIQVTNRENVIEQVKLATELISSFCYECCKIFEGVQMYDVVGNHSRITKKEEAIHDERLDSLISWGVNLSLKASCPNFHWMQHRNLDSGIADISACGQTYIAVHGDMDPASKGGASNLSMMLGFVPTAIFRGHLHSPAWNEYNGVRVIQGGSLAGSGDSYTLEKRIFGKPSQTICICNSKGIRAHIPVELD